MRLLQWTYFGCRGFNDICWVLCELGLVTEMRDRSGKDMAHGPLLLRSMR